MPETAAGLEGGAELLGAFFGGGGAEAAGADAFLAGSSAVGAGEVGGAFGADALAAGAGAGAGVSAESLGALGGFGSEVGAGLSSFGATDSLGAFEGIGSGAGGSGVGYYGAGSAPPSGGLFNNPGIASLFKKGGSGLDIMKMLAGIYGLSQSSKLSTLATKPNLMGEQAVKRSLASQGYQGSGNMMAALNQYGIGGSQAAAQAGMSPLAAQLSSLGLLTSGTPALATLFGPG